MPEPADSADRQIRRLTRRSLLTGAVAGSIGVHAWGWLTTATHDGGIPWPLRRMLRLNEGLAERLGSPAGLAPTFPVDCVENPARVNGLVGLSTPADAMGWRIQIRNGDEKSSLPLTALLDLPRTELITEFKCVEGWSRVMQFAGYRFVDFVNRFGLARRGSTGDYYRHVYLATPDEAYYVGLDIASILHPQTLLCDRMNGIPLSREHGAPLRLYLGVKYGYKSLKRIGIIRFSDERPPDYWADRGYDWYAGL
jgi:DMSO/TMAO reductase YedYZ molybdopterin-dependent catalytic subunit